MLPGTPLFKSGEAAARNLSIDARQKVCLDPFRKPLGSTVIELSAPLDPGSVLPAAGHGGQGGVRPPGVRRVDGPARWHYLVDPVLQRAVELHLGGSEL